MFSTKLRQLREKAGIPRKELAQILGLSVSAISNYENDLRKPDTDDIWRKIADYFGVSVDWLMKLDDSDYPETIVSNTGSIDDLSPTETSHPQVFTLTPTPTVKLPILGEVAAGMGAYADNNIIGYEDVPQNWTRGNSDYVLLRVHGDSMVPKFEENDLLLVRVQTSVDSGDYAIALVDDENGVVKRVMYGKDWIELQSQNPMYAPRRFEGADVQRIRIFGLVKKSIRDY